MGYELNDGMDIRRKWRSFIVSMMLFNDSKE